jgi:hypothetical protein
MARRVLKKLLLVFVTALVLAVLLGCTWELRHRRYLGHFVGYGIHTDMFCANEDWGVPGIRASYSMRVINLTLWPVKFQVIKLPGGFVGYGFEYHEVIQRWDNKTGWVTFSDSTALEQGTPSSNPNATVTLWPGQSVYPTGVEALGAREGISEGDRLRILIFPKFAVSTAERGKAIYSQPFVVHR